MPPPFPFEPAPIRLPLALEIVMTVWFFCLGGCIGSFMNVVIFRVPRGRSVVSPASRCPKCGNAIRGYDNLPILSWLLLRGRCRDCQTPISVRYPVVELIMALFFMLLAGEALISGGPWWVLNFVPGTFLAIDWPRLALAFTHYSLLMSTLVCAAYIAWDGEHSPWRLFAPSVVVCGLIAMYWNEVRPLAHSSPDVWQTAWAGFREGLSGAALGLVLGVLFDTLFALRNADGQPRGQTRIALAVCGWALGTKVVPFIVGAMAVVALLWFVVSGRRWRSAASAPLVGIAAATAALLLAGRLLFEHWLVLGLSERSWSVIAAVVALATAGLLRLLAPKPEAIEMSSPMMVPVEESTL